MIVSLWDVMDYILVAVYRCFREYCCFHNQGHAGGLDGWLLSRDRLSVSVCRVCGGEGRIGA
jgi:hypothetical protein